MTEEAHARLRTVFLLVSLIVLLLAVGFRRPGDFESFYISGTQFLKGLNPYDPALYKTYRSFGMSSLPPAIILTCLPCFLPLQIAISVWDVFCLLLWCVSIYIWVDLLKKAALSLSEFTQVGAACLIAPLCWAFQTHQVTVPILFFASLAAWGTERRHPKLAGFSVGCMLMKPHLTLLLAAALFFNTRRKFIFVLTMAAALFLPYIPFMNTWRPLSDLRTWAETIEHQQTEVHYLDEQDLFSRAASFFPLVTKKEAKESNGPGVLIPKSQGRHLVHFKTVFWIVGCLLWGIWWFTTRAINPLFLYSSALAWGLLISPYSHFYDGVLLTPLVLLGLYRSHKGIAQLFPLFFGFNFMVITLVTLANRYNFYLWPLMGWTSLAYCGLATLTIGWANRPIIPLLYKRSSIR